MPGIYCLSIVGRRGREARMAKTLVDVDEEQLAAAQEVLQTASKKDTINAALRQVRH